VQENKIELFFFKFQVDERCVACITTADRLLFRNRGTQLACISTVKRHVIGYLTDIAYKKSLDCVGFWFLAQSIAL